MARKKKKVKKNIFLNLLLLIASLYLIRKIFLLGPIEQLIRYIFILIIIVVNVTIFTSSSKKNSKKVVIVILIVINIISGLFIDSIYSTLSNISSNKTIYKTSLVVLNENKINKIKDIKNTNIGILNDTNSIEGYTLALKIINKNKLDKNNKILKYNSYPELLDSLYDKKVDAIFIPSNYKNMFSNIEKYENISSDIKVITKIEEKAKEKKYGTKDIKEPFTMLLMGIDSSVDGLGNSDSFNGDSLMVVTFNPNTLNATILSIPRDSYVPIMCFDGHYENKITHAAWKGTDCVIKTIENFLDIKIDYYAKINFKGLVKLVDELGGITVEVPKDLCTDNSDRKGQICIKKGIQKLNGEEALVLSRNRKQLANGDIDRGMNQQVVLQGIIDSAKNIDNVDTLLDILKVISNNLDMNMKEETILSFYNVGKNILSRSKNSESLVTLQKLYLAGYGQIIYDERTNLNLWDYVLNEESINDVSNEMKINLGLEEPKLIKEFSFSIDTPYEQKIVGKGPYKEYTVYDLVPDFSTATKDEAINWGNQYGINIVFNEISSSGKSGKIIDQSQPYKKRIDKIDDKEIILTIVK